MSTLIDKFITFLQILGAIAGLSTLVYLLYKMLHAQAQPADLYSGVAREVLRSRYLVVATLIFIFLCYLFWHPFPVGFSRLQLLFLSASGGIILFPSLALYIWGLVTLGENFNVSSGFGVRLQKTRRLITSGPFAFVRHPMYLAVILTCWGSLLLYRTWTMLFLVVIMHGLIYRAQKEEDVLTQVFAAEWEAYKAHVPGWIPRIKRKR
jgi:protein-S-isoprenylcysteine O-methyltransferase Ste14